MKQRRISPFPSLPHADFHFSRQWQLSSGRLIYANPATSSGIDAARGHRSQTFDVLIEILFPMAVENVKYLLCVFGLHLLTVQTHGWVRQVRHCRLRNFLRWLFKITEIPVH